ncbi:hypothetical protein [uncultured Tateyamaria sp.]|uniref:hypothetical protein n=1 Tax=uncultured Tateyamaria sp. TaxID=455651 RepID=UPI0026368F1A|nr:hypothetical protein [uncultured Tateyamaria sp.]
MNMTAPCMAKPGTACVEARELLRGRVAVVHIGTRGDQTYIGVGRLPVRMGGLE